MRPSRWLMILAASALLCGAAIYNRYPLLYPDAIEYLRMGPLIVRKLLYGEPSAYYGTRSAFYSLSIYPLHLGITPWPIVVVNALLTVAVLRVTLRTVLDGGGDRRLLGVVLALAVLSPLSFIVSFVMPDIFTPLLVLCAFGLTLGWEKLTRGGRVFLAALSVYALVVHGSHPLLLAGLIPVVVVLHLTSRDPRRRVVRSVACLLAVLVLGGGANMALHAALYGHPLRSGPRALYLTARLVADRTAQRYLDEHGDETNWAINAFSGRLTHTAHDFLFAPDGPIQRATPEQRQQLRDEETAFAWAVVSAYPLEQTKESLLNIARQLKRHRIDFYEPHRVMTEQIERAIPGDGARYHTSRQAEATLPLESLSTWFAVFEVASLLVIAVLFGPVRRNLPLLASLGVLVVAALVIHATITGVISGPYSRFQARVVWLLPLTACLMVLGWLDARRGGETDAPPTGR